MNYPATLAATGAEVGFIRTDPDRDFSVTKEGIAAALRPNTKAIVFSNPNNLSGRRLRHDEMLALANVALERDLCLISDEIYGDLSYRDPWRPVQYGGFVSLASSGLIDDRLVVLGSLSKSHAMTGWRMGWMIAPQSLVAQATALADIVFHGLPGFVQESALEAIPDKTTPERAVEIYRRRRYAFAAGLGHRHAPIAIMPEAWSLHSLRDPKHRFERFTVCRTCPARRGGGACRRRALWPIDRRLRERCSDPPRGRPGQGRPASRRAFSSL